MWRYFLNKSTLLDFREYRRITTSNHYIPEIDGMRFIAILPVVLLHIHTLYVESNLQNMPEGYENTFIFWFFHNSGWGVKFFFAISGYILSIPFAKYHFKKANSKKVNLSKYFTRRLTRLEPPFIISLCVIYFSMILVMSEGGVNSFKHFLATFFYSHVFIYGEWSTINPVTWSLETEVQFYILAPVLALMFKIRSQGIRYLVILILSLLSIELNGSKFLETYHMDKSIIVHLHYFLIGFLVVDIQLNFSRFFEKSNYFIEIFALLGVPLLYFFKFLNIQVLFDACMLMFFISIFKSRIFKQVLSTKIISTIGGMCYSIYLIHFALIYVFFQVFDKPIFDDFYLGLFYSIVVCS